MPKFDSTWTNVHGNYFKRTLETCILCKNLISYKVKIFDAICRDESRIIFLPERCYNSGESKIIFP